MSSLSFNTVIVTGGSGGLGRAIAEWLQREGKKVILVGRTESKLKETSKAMNDAPYYTLDTGDTKAIPGFAKMVIKDHPEVDGLINNAGVQRVLTFDDFDLAKADQEIDTNIRGPMHLAAAFLPHFKEKPNSVIVNVSSVLGFCPMSIVNPVYNGTKAWLHFHTMNLRTQLQKHAPNVTVIEIAPPAVGTDLHRDRDDPDDNKKDKMPTALTIEEFMDDIIPQWKGGATFITAGPLGHGTTKKWYDAYGEQYEKVASNFN